MGLELSFFLVGIGLSAPEGCASVVGWDLVSKCELCAFGECGFEVVGVSRGLELLFGLGIDWTGLSLCLLSSQDMTAGDLGLVG